jgi:peptidyl-dipeptidase A
MPYRAVIVFVVVVMCCCGSVARAEGPSADEAQAFVAQAESELLASWIEAERAAWVQANFITGDTQLIAAKAKQRMIEVNVRLAHEAARFDGLELPADTARKLMLIKTALTLPAPSDEAATEELTQITAGLEGAYGAGVYCRADGSCLDLGTLEDIMATSRNPGTLLDAWTGWRTVSVPMRKDFVRYVELANQGARELGFTDIGALWRSKYDMPADDFAADLDRIWLQVKPLYDKLHCYVRARLVARYGSDVVPPDGPIPAHLLGNMWAQSWRDIDDVVAPGDADPGYDLTALLQQRGVDPLEMVRIGEGFFSSLGFEPLPETFWQRSLFTKPRDRDVVCHASAWDIDWKDDLRLKMCIDINAEDFETVHHELGHNYYQRAYNDLDPLYRDSANDGFHEAVGDTLALSITPAYLVKLGFLDEMPESDVVALQLRSALDKIAFLPFGLLVDQYRWKVFSGEISPQDYNAAWWALRLKYQGVAPPVTRSEADFDPGAKYHVTANVPYTRYFLAGVLQFQLHRALCQAAGFEGPLNECSIYGNPAAGAKLKALLEMGREKPWQDALEAATGSRQVDATAILDYYAPLSAWLDEQTEGLTCGW